MNRPALMLALAIALPAGAGVAHADSTPQPVCTSMTSGTWKIDGVYGQIPTTSFGGSATVDTQIHLDGPDQSATSYSVRVVPSPQQAGFAPGPTPTVHLSVDGSSHGFAPNWTPPYVAGTLGSWNSGFVEFGALSRGTHTVHATVSVPAGNQDGVYELVLDARMEQPCTQVHESAGGSLSYYFTGGKPAPAPVPAPTSAAPATRKPSARPSSAEATPEPAPSTDAPSPSASPSPSESASPTPSPTPTPSASAAPSPADSPSAVPLAATPVAHGSSALPWVAGTVVLLAALAAGAVLLLRRRRAAETEAIPGTGTPEAPETPAEAVVTAAPTEPVATVAPAESTEPAEPVTPEAPAEPAPTVAPAESATSEAPAESAKPAEPVTPEAPAEPAQTEEPVSPDAADGPAKPEPDTN
ncbi:hypothetical protein [Kitasatospora azatica]|uniref:hypothetical protein n=1 Tax=Kitasatospora azatica TaxID=58347 RepID=UPI0005678574|nr:hypothetical protein [Kitasatospora azatica]